MLETPTACLHQTGQKANCLEITNGTPILALLAKMQAQALKRGFVIGQVERLKASQNICDDSIESELAYPQPCLAELCHVTLTATHADSVHLT